MCVCVCMLNVVFITALLVPYTPVVSVQHGPLHSIISVRIDDSNGVHIVQNTVHRQLIYTECGGGECVQTGVAVRALCV